MFGQVYIPVVNYVLMGLTMIVVGTFQTSARLGEAYGELSNMCACNLPERLKNVLLGYMHAVIVTLSLTINTSVQLLCGTQCCCCQS